MSSSRLVTALFLALTACGGSTSTPPDAARADASARVADAAVVDALPSIDARPPGITCGGSTCTPTQACCASDQNSSYVCGDPSAFCVGTHAQCDGPEDCPGGVCCAGPGGAGNYTMCSSSCGLSTVCHTTADCPPTMVCAPYADGYSVCESVPDAGP